MIGFQRFDAEEFQRKLMEYGDIELIKMGKAMSPAGSRWKDPATQSANAAKYELCKAEWKRRHPARSKRSHDEV
jgi:hypothetical protein